MICHDTNERMNIGDNICHKKVDCRVLVSGEKPSAPRAALIHNDQVVLNIGPCQEMAMAKEQIGKLRMGSLL